MHIAPPSEADPGAWFDARLCEMNTRLRNFPKLDATPPPAHRDHGDLAYLFPVLPSGNAAQVEAFMNEHSTRIARLFQVVDAAFDVASSPSHTPLAVLRSVLGVSEKSASLPLLAQTVGMSAATFARAAKRGEGLNKVLQRVVAVCEAQASSSSSSLSSSSGGCASTATAAAALTSLATSRPVLQALQRFSKAHKGGHGTPLSTALRELQSGKKASHWIWYIFPQVLDPGRSSINNTTFQIKSQTEAVAYVLHPELGHSLEQLFGAVHQHLCGDGKSAIPCQTLMSTNVDAKKLHHSSSTFRFAIGLILSENERLGGALSVTVPERIWQRVLFLKKTIAEVILAIQKKPYSTAPDPCPAHDPVIEEGWKKLPPWKVE